MITLNELFVDSLEEHTGNMSLVVSANIVDLGHKSLILAYIIWNGKPHGKWTRYHLDGKVSIDEEYSNGK